MAENWPCGCARLKIRRVLAPGSVLLYLTHTPGEEEGRDLENLTGRKC